MKTIPGARFLMLTPVPHLPEASQFKERGQQALHRGWRGNIFFELDEDSGVLFHAQCTVTTEYGDTALGANFALGMAVEPGNQLYLVSFTVPIEDELSYTAGMIQTIVHGNLLDLWSNDDPTQVDEEADQTYARLGMFVPVSYWV